ncbi:hypothetical protein F2Q70_00029532 [Brassica cretica]|uniref:Uncharacterized protein n=1 Tax=Brassica cretica TaxID=69181 RepID=A0A8S9FM66_BRACR|nr:hypothetical protein F2Q70_00029532 [Brassica cretica]
MIWLRYMGASIEEHTRMHGFGLPVDRCPRPFGCYIATWSALDRSLRSYRPRGLVGRYVVTSSFADRSLRGDLCLDLYLTFHERVLRQLVFGGSIEAF